MWSPWMKSLVALKTRPIWLVVAGNAQMEQIKNNDGSIPVMQQNHVYNLQ